MRRRLKLEVELIGPYLLLPFVVLLILGVPIAFSLGLASAIFLFFSGTTIPHIVLVTEMYTAVDSFALLALPMFVLTGELLNRCHLTERLIDVARLLVGWIKGGLAHVNIVTSMFFAGISGSVLADAATIGPILIPAMIKERYPRAFSAAVTGASAVIGAIIPPSIPLIIVGGQLQISIGGLFAAGIVPGVLVGLFLMLAAYVICRRNDYGNVHRFERLAPATTSAFKAAPALLIPVFILSGILSGVFTPTEAGAAAVAYTLLLGALLYRTLSRSKLVASLIATARVTASALLIVAAAVVFSRLLTFYRVPQEILDVLLSITDSRVLLFLIIIVFFLAAGTFMDALANMIILGPLLMPVAVEGLGMHPLQFGVFLMVGLLLGVLTPPLGLVLFVVAPVAKVSIERLSLAVIPFLAAELAVLLLIAFVPEVTLGFPRASGLID